MGVEKKVSLLPAPTESDSTTRSTEFESHVTEKTSFSLPEDGSPITIATTRKKSGKDNYGLKTKKSQTSLLIEYFEGSKTSHSQTRRPSVRVKVRPSSKVRRKSSSDEIQISEKRIAYKKSCSRKNQLQSKIKASKPSDLNQDNPSTSSLCSTTEDSTITSRESGSIEVEITPRRHGSPLIPTIDYNSKCTQITNSEISSMPDDSFLDGKTQSSSHKHDRSLISERASTIDANAEDAIGNTQDQLKAPLLSRSRSNSRERIVIQKAIEKVRNENSEQRRRKHSSRSKSMSTDFNNAQEHPPDKSVINCRVNTKISGVDSSLFNSHLSAKSGEACSYRSGTSKSSINNPKLLETVEDAIRRLILPELTALKQEQSRRNQRAHRNSMTSSSSTSKNSKDDNLIVKKSEPDVKTNEAIKSEVKINDSEILSSRTAELSPDIEHIHYIEDKSTTVHERETSTEKVIRENEQLQRSDKNEKLQLSKDAPSETDMQEMTNKIELKNSLHSFDQAEKKLTPNTENHELIQSSNLSHSPENSLPMPLLHQINPSEVTRSSILSAQSTMLSQANKDSNLLLHEVHRGIVSPISFTPNRAPVTLQHGLGTQYSNLSRGNVSLHSQGSEPHLQPIAEHELDHYSQKITKKVIHTYESVEEESHHKNITVTHSSPQNTDNEGVLAGGTSMKIDNHNQNSNDTQDKHQYFYQDIVGAPKPLNYIPYAYERRGLSPIQSVSGYTEGGSENKRESRLTRCSGSYSSIDCNPTQRHSGIQKKSHESVESQYNTYDFLNVRHGGLSDSEITQDNEYWDEKHGGNDKIKVKNDFALTADVKSTTVSVVNETHLNGKSGAYSKIDDNALHISPTCGLEKDLSTIVYPEPEVKGHLITSASQELDLNNCSSTAVTENQRGIDGSSTINVQESQVSLSTEEALVLATAAVSSNRKRNLVSHGRYDDDYNIQGPLEHKSFKERAMECPDQIQLFFSEKDDGKNKEKSGIYEKYHMSASGAPDLNDPMPEIGFGHNDSEVLTNPSIINGSTGKPQHKSEDHHSFQSTPSQRPHITNSRQKSIPENYSDIDENVLVGDDVKIEEVIRRKEHEVGNLEDWKRNSLDRKRETIVTNPYENTSPVAVVDILDRDITDFQGFLPNKLPFPSENINSPKIEDFISPVPNRSQEAKTPELESRKITEAKNDQFYTPKHKRNFSGMSHGMSSPLYDSATGNGIDRIESKDIVALMDHLTVRDAQRSARDTEILVTLVRAAAEMRNSFEDMKRLLADSEDVIITEVQANTEKSVQKVMYGPRPPPQSGRSFRPVSYHEIYDDIPAKKRNVFRRALKGLSMKSANDLGKIEEMLVQLLGEVEGLKVAQGLKPLGQQVQSNDQLYRENNDQEQDEPETSTSYTTGDNLTMSGHTARETSQTKTYDSRKALVHRHSPKQERHINEDEYEAKAYVPQQTEKNDQKIAPYQEINHRDQARPSSSPIPTRESSSSNQQTLHAATEKSRKFKSGSSSSWIPRVSRWSETTASSVFRGFRNSGRSGSRKAGDTSPSSRPVSFTGNFPTTQFCSSDKFQAGYYDNQLNQDKTEAPVPCLSPEDPKFKAHRDSMNLQHPQPRQGPTDRHQTTLESEADNFEDRTVLKNNEWEQERSQSQLSTRQRNYRLENMSPSDGEYVSSILSPTKPPPESFGHDRSITSRAKSSKPSPLSTENLIENQNNQTRPSQRHLRGLQCMPIRKPTGPRTMTHPQADFKD